MLVVSVRVHRNEIPGKDFHPEPAVSIKVHRNASSSMIMNLETATMPRPETTIHVTAPGALNRPQNHSSQSLPQRSPFGIQELLGLGNSESRQGSSGPVSAVTPSLYSSGIVGQTPFSADHHHMTMAASRMAYFNAHAAVAAAFLPHNMGSAGHLGLHHHQATGKYSRALARDD